jgi:hypothetical protein
MATITIIQPDGTSTTEERVSSARPGLDELQKAVGGYIESVDRFLAEGTVAYANEEGLLVGLDRNPVATKRVKWPHPIVGPVIICEGFDPEE